MHPRFSLAFVLAALELHVARLKAVYATVVLALCIGGGVAAFFLFVPPFQFPKEVTVTISEGDSLPVIAEALATQGFIRSPELFMAIARLTHSDTRIQAGEYVFHRPAGMLTVLRHLREGITGVELVRVALTEGMTARDMARELTRALSQFDQAAFEEKAIPLEGYLFPDTYFFPTDTTPDEVIERLYENFETHIADIDKELLSSERPLPDLVIMASLIEREARSLSEKRMIAGILWHRLSINMPLQVDAVFGYINNRATYSPSFADLEIDSPYNTYLYPGLPPGPIANPGLDSLRAAATSIETEALYYLTGKDGKMYYANTFAEHRENRARHLD